MRYEPLWDQLMPVILMGGVTEYNQYSSSTVDNSINCLEILQT